MLNSRLGKVRYVPPALQLIWKAARYWTIAWLLLLLGQSILPILSVYLIRELVNDVAAIIREGWTSPIVQTAVMIAISIGAVQLLSQVLSSLINWVRIAQAELVRDYITSLIQEKATSLDLSFFDDPNYYDLLHRVSTDARQMPLSLLENIGGLATATLTLIGLLAILISYSPFLPVVLIFSTLPALWVILRYSRRYSRWRQQNTPNERRAFYYDFLLTDRAPASEMRLFSLSMFYRHSYSVLRSKLRLERYKLATQKMLTELIATVVATIGVAAALLWMGWRVLQGLGTLGDLAAFYQVFQQGQNLMQTVMQSAGNIYQNILFLDDLFVFLALQPKIKITNEPPLERIPLHKEIRFENVTFRYPESARNVLENFSMTIPAGKIIALVGENGMGKTTLMKLLCRFYDPNEGRVLWDGVDLRALPLEVLQREITMLFQVPFQYPESARHNVAVGDINSAPPLSKIKVAAQFAGADEVISHLPQGYDTMLGKWFGGEELSVGQWQRVSLARAILREASVMILDEPTSAMDAWAEMEWLSHLRKIPNAQTRIIITHRFTTAMKADLIYLIQNQQIVEQGSHEELLALGKRYATVWMDQLRQPSNP